jgi:hypothetical protein
MDVFSKKFNQELLAVKPDGKNVDKVTWVVFIHLWYGTLDEEKHTLVNFR